MMKNVWRYRNRERGAVSLFVVVFATLLITVLTVSFVRLMVHDQQQATLNDLSQSAYDSALAGVEDAKRALVACQNGDTATCQALDSESCTSLIDAGFVAGSGGANAEVSIQTTIGDDSAALDQAYTCVKVLRATDDVVDVAQVGVSRLIPLKAAGAFDRIRVSWFSNDDFRSDSGALSYYAKDGADLELPSVDSNAWKETTPSLLRAQLIQHADDGFTLNDLDTNENDSATHSLFLYPVEATTTPANQFDFTLDNRRTAGGEPKSVLCSAVLTGGYACTATLVLPQDASDTGLNTYLRLTALYNSSHYSIRLFDGATPVKFDNVQPKIDSTGRANDLFRRVESRVQFDSQFPYPDNAVDISGSLCKSFSVTDKETDNPNGAACITP